ncbi:MAG: HEPN domain-containing protein [Actinomycetota bacterium]|nr:HEPN domain-containing protein [Actinomycetota bacterium]
MPTLTQTSLTEVERRALDLFVERVGEHLGDDLLAIWLYGSRARGDAPSGPESDVDVRVLAASDADATEIHGLALDAGMEADGDWINVLHVVVDSLPRWHELRRLDAFIVRELESDAIALHGPHPREVGANIEPVRPLPGEMHPRSKLYLDGAIRKLRTARQSETDPASLVSLSYFAIVEAVRTALSEEDVSPRTHSGMWHEFHSRYVRTGRFDPALHTAGHRLEKLRNKADYGEPGAISDEKARAAFDTAERFVAAVREMLGA